MTGAIGDENPAMRFALVLLVMGCVSNRVNGRPEVVTWQPKLMPIAAFDMNCPEDQLVVVDLGGGEKAGVSGCDKREVYVYDGNHSWDRASNSVVAPKDR